MRNIVTRRPTFWLWFPKETPENSDETVKLESTVSNIDQNYATTLLISPL